MLGEAAPWAPEASAEAASPPSVQGTPGPCVPQRWRMNAAAVEGHFGARRGRVTERMGVAGESLRWSAGGWTAARSAGGGVQRGRTGVARTVKTGAPLRRAQDEPRSREGRAPGGPDGRSPLPEESRKGAHRAVEKGEAPIHRLPSRGALGGLAEAAGWLEATPMKTGDAGRGSGLKDRL